MTISVADLPRYNELMYPVLRSLHDLGGSAQIAELRRRVTDDMRFDDEAVALTYPDNPKSVLVDRIDWARSYLKMSDMLDSPKRGLVLITAKGRDVIGLPESEARAALAEADRAVRAESTLRSRQRAKTRINDDDVPPAEPVVDELGQAQSEWTTRKTSAGRLHCSEDCIAFLRPVSRSSACTSSGRTEWN